MAAPTARAQAESDYLIKLLLVGDSGVGKSSLILQFSVGSFTTIGFDFKIRTVELDGKLIKLQIWDTAGHECFRTIATGAMGILLVYDVTDESSFNNIRNWVKNIEQHASYNLNKILIGNKADMDESKRAVPTSKGQALAKEYGIQFFETSAKTNQNVEQVFFSIARDIKQRLSEADPKHEQGRRAMARSWSKLEQPLERRQDLANSIREKCSDKMPVIGEKAKANADAVFSSKDEDWQKHGSDFVKEFYERLDNAPEDLHRLYSSRCEVSWFINDISYVMKSPKEVHCLMATERHLGKFCIENVVIQKNKHSVQVVVNGIHQFNRCSNFFQSFALHHRKRSILSDVLHVVADVSPFKFKVKLASTQAAMTKENDSNSKVTAVGAVENSEVLLVYNESCLHHVPPDEAHHENPNRITSILAALKRDGVLGRVVSEGSEPANRKYLRAVHTEKYLDELIDKLPLSAEELKSCPYISKSVEEMYSSSGSKEAVYLAAGAVMKACQSVARGDFKKSFALVRPPGHHARSDHAEGFCYVNNAAAGAKHLIELGMRKVFLVDFDVHHGNGSQYIFYEDNSVLVFSIHCKSIGFPKNSKDKKLSQAHTAIGAGKGKGYNINVPLDIFGDADLLYVIDQVLAPLVSLFKPDAILVSAGFDAAAKDPLGLCKVTHRCFGTITKKLVELGKGKLIMCLEGGYNIDLLGDCVSHCLRALLGDDDACLSEEELRCMSEPSTDTKNTVRKLKKFVKDQWDLFNT